MTHGTFDFETASEAGHAWVEPTQVWDPKKEKWKDVLGKWVLPKGVGGNRKKGLGVVGTAAYAEHPTTRVLTLTYKLPAVWPNGYAYPRGGLKQRWRPGLPLPQDLFDFLAAGGVMEAHNIMFERFIWELCCVPKYGWPSSMPWFYQFRCSMAKARVNQYPGGLEPLGDVLRIPVQKDKAGKALLDKFSVPRNPTKTDPRIWITPEDDPADAERLYSYCDTDVDAEEMASASMPDLSTDELLFWWIDQEINWRGIGIDRAGVRNCIAVLEQAFERYGDEFRQITGGLNPTQLEATLGWLAAKGLRLYSMDAESVEEALARLPPPPPQGDPRRRVLEIRQLLGSASVKKLYAMEYQASGDDRLRNLLVHHGARTGRPTGEGPQPLNLPKAGPELKWCVACDSPYAPKHYACPFCAHVPDVQPKVREWSAAAVDAVLAIMATRNLDLVEWYFGDAVLCIMGVVRGLFVAAPGCDLIASDYSAIEAVVTAMLSGCQWRIEAFRNNEPIYLLSASKITGTPVETYLRYKEETGQHHPDRQKKGKVNELANGFGGWIGASRQFGAEGTDDEIKAQILAWRRASPEIPELWGGQKRGWKNSTYDPLRQEYFGFEGAAVQALQFPGLTFEAAGIKFCHEGYDPGQEVTEWDAFLEEHVTRTINRKPGALIVTLLSGRRLTYHEPRLTASTLAWAAPWEVSIAYMTWNTNPKYGMLGWVPMSTYGGRLTENIVQAIAHDILRFAIINLRAAGYPCVLHVYDEVVVEVPHGCGSIEEVERIMAIMPPWASGWPVRASGGWRGRRYRKD